MDKNEGLGKGRNDFHAERDRKTMEETGNHLRDTALFNGLTAEQIRKMMGIARKVTFRQDDVIMEEGQAGDTMYVILDGTVQVVKSLVMKGMEDEDGKSKVFTKLDAGQRAVFGEIALLEDSERTATVTAITDCTLCEIRKDDFLRLAESDYALGYRVLLNLARIVSSRLRKVNEDIVKLTTVLSLVLKED